MDACVDGGVDGSVDACVDRWRYVCICGCMGGHRCG